MNVVDISRETYKNGVETIADNDDNIYIIM